MTLYDRYPTIAVAEDDTVGADLLQQHPNVSELRRGPGTALFLKFYDPAFATVRQLGAQAETADPAAWAANAKAIREWQRLFAGRPGGPALTRNQLMLAEHYEMLSRRDILDMGLRCFMSNPPAPLQTITAKTKSQQPRVGAFIDEVAAALDMWLREGARGRFLGVEKTKGTFQMRFEVTGEHPLDAAVGGLVLLCASDDIQKVELRAPGQ